MNAIFDGIILGTGHNALILQAYLSRCGLKTLSGGEIGSITQLIVDGRHAAINRLEQEANGDHLKRMNHTAGSVASDCASAGWILMASIAKSLHHYTSGAYRPSERLV